MKKNRVLIVLVIFCLVSFFSCTPLSKIKYLQQISNDIKSDTLINTSKVYRLQKGDQLYIDILTSIPEMNVYISGKNAASSQLYTSPTDIYLKSYQINDSGYIYLPFAGKFIAENKTIDEIKLDINSAISKFITDAVIVVKLANFNVTVIGEVNKPGMYYANNNRINIFEAIGLAGDLTIYGNRKKVTVMRRMQNGDYKLFYADITKSNVVSCEVFNLKPNDVIYFEPLSTKPFGLGTFPYATILSAITTLLLIINYTK